VVNWKIQAGTLDSHNLQVGQLARPRFELVSAETQPVSGRSRAQISDIENLASRDTPPGSRLSEANVQIVNRFATSEPGRPSI
jgi:hypothetical protein